MSNQLTEYAMELLIDEAILYADDVEDIKAELSGESYADAMMRELGITSDEALFGEM